MDAKDAAAPFLILAHHRSGSNFLNDLVQAHPCVDCINEPFT
jgi:LPS sulfotransferase NodH